MPEAVNLDHPFILYSNIVHIIYLRAVVYYTTIRELFAGLCPEECVIYRGRTAVSERKEGPQHDDERPQIKRNALISIRMFPLVSHPPTPLMFGFFFLLIIVPSFLSSLIPCLCAM